MKKKSLLTKKILLRMKLTIVAVCVCFLQVSATIVTSGQNITMNVKGETLKTVIEEIENQTKYRFFYNESFTDLNKIINFNVNEMPFNRALDILFNGLKINYKILENNLVVIAPNSILQQINVTGIVTDESGVPLPGVNVIIEGGSAGTITDLDGRYNIELPQPNIKLVFSYIGYVSQKFVVTSSSAIDVKLVQDQLNIDEIVVVVVGTSMRKSDLTGSVVSVSAGQLRDVPTSSVLQAIQGKATGVYVQNNPAPGSKSSIKIRGNNSIQFGTNPIFVVDGLVIDGGFEMLNPEDISSVDILKDASATAIYGSRGANGVVVITTKKGKKGQSRITYDFWTGTQKFSNEMPLMNGNQIYDLRVDAYANAYIDKNPNADRIRYIEKSLTNINPIKNLIFSKEELESYTDSLSYNWLDQIIRNGFQQNHALSFSGGDDKGSYFTSLNYNEQKGQILKSGYSRISGRLNVEQNVKKQIKVGSNNSFIYTKEQPVVNDNMFITALRASPLLPFSDEYWYMREGKVDNQSASNPFRDLTITKDNLTSRLISSNYLNISPIDGLNIRTTYSIDLQQGEYYTYYPTTSTQSYKGAMDGQSVQLKNKNLNWQWDNSINYSHIFAAKHKVALLLGSNMSHYSNNYNQQNASGYNNDLFIYKNSQGASDKTKFYLASDFSTYSIQSYLARADYAYDSRYYITLTGRSDGSSKFGTSNKWGFFPSVAVSWNINNEQFMKSQTIISNLRLRFGYGIAGNQNIPNYGYMTIYYPSISLESNILRNYGRYGNPNLRWEKQKQINFGLNAGFLEERISLAFDIFQINNEDLLMERSTAPSSGYTSKLDNIGALENKGFELAISANVIKTSNLNWNIAFNVNFDRNKITRLYDNVTEIYNLGGYSNNEIQREGNLFLGESLNNIYVYKFDRIVQESDMEYVNSLDLSSRIVKPGDILPSDRDKNGIINDNDRYVVGKIDPDFYGGISTELSYKGFALNINATYSKGAQRISYLYETLMGSGGNSGAHTDLLNRWTPQNTNTNIPRAYSDGGRYGLGEVDWAIQDASFFRLAETTLSYSIPEKWSRSIKIERLRVYFTGNNLLAFTKYKGFDPESGDWYPSYKMYVLGVNVSF